MKNYLLEVMLLLWALCFPAIAAGYTTQKTVNLIISAQDNLSGVSRMQFSNNGLDWSPPEPFAARKDNWDITCCGGNDSEGSKSVYVRFQDNAGNWSAPVFAVVEYFPIPPGSMKLNSSTGAWLSPWQYRWPVTITETSGGALSNYQVGEIQIQGSNPAAPNYVDFSRFRMDGFDLRFADSDGGTELAFWRRDWDPLGKSAKLWVKVPQLAGGLNHVVYLYAGNPAAADANNPDAVFEFFDDFAGGVLTTAKWTEDAVGNPSHFVNNYLRFTDATRSWWIYHGNNTGSQHQAKWIPIPDFIVEFSSQISDTVPNQMGQGFVGLIAPNNEVIAVAGYEDGYGNTLTPDRRVIIENGANYRLTVANGDRRDWKIEHSGTTVKVYDNSGLLVTGTRSSAISKLALAAGAYRDYPFVNYVQIDNLKVRKYAKSQPTWRIGALESQ